MANGDERHSWDGKRLIPSPHMKRLRFVIALALAAVLGGVLVFFSLGGSLQHDVGPGQVTKPDTSYRLAAIVTKGSPSNAATLAATETGLRFTVQDIKNSAKRITILYRGTVPDTFKDGREVVVTGKLQNGVFVAERDSLVTKCPSKFQGKSPDSAT
jgi:cytochrome c-type biogenesis protein CcmE